MTLADLVAGLERRAAEAEAVGATAPLGGVYRAVIDELRRVQNCSGARPPAAQTLEDRLLTVDEAASRMGVSVEWVYRYARRLPFTRKLGPKTLRFSETGLTRYLERPR